MYSFFHSRVPEPPPLVEPVPTLFPNIAGADIAAVFAGKRVAGDFYDSVRVGPGRVLFGLMDVAGRREDNRTVLIAAQEVFRKLGAKLFSPSDVNESDAMTELCLAMNRTVIDAEKGVRSCPAFLACYHELLGTLCYTNAGHIPGLVRDSSGISELSSTGLPMGLFSHATCDAPTQGMEKGAALLLVSRGVVECGLDHDKRADEFGLERVKQLLQDAAPNRARELCTGILNSVDRHGHSPVLSDDRTALALVRSA